MILRSNSLILAHRRRWRYPFGAAVFLAVVGANQPLLATNGEPRSFAVAESAVVLNVEPYLSFGVEHEQVVVRLEPEESSTTVPIAGWVDTNIRNALEVNIRPPQGAPGVWTASLDADLELVDGIAAPMRLPALVTIHVRGYHVKAPVVFNLLLDAGEGIEADSSENGLVTVSAAVQLDRGL